MHRLDDLSQLIEPGLRALHAYWSVKRGARPMPARADIDPVEVPRLLPHLMLVAVSDDPPRFRFRLVGTEIVARYGDELTGRALDEIDLGGEIGSIQSQYEETVRAAAPTYCRHAIETRQGKYLRYERLLLPLSSDGIRVDMLLGGVYLLPAAAEAKRP
ncbi:MAG: PAS domain-containing protein [Alphaproteobacteria bacterium]